MASPIFVVGKPRSGTKWISNIIANSADVACVQRPGAGGIVETNILTVAPAVFGDPAVEENYSAFLAFVSRTNFFKLMELPEDALYQRRCEHYLDFFRMLMDQYAKKTESPRWLQKSDSVALPSLYPYFPDARFVIIQRDNIENNIASTVALHVDDAFDDGSKRIASRLAAYFYFRKLEERFVHAQNVITVKFENLVRDKQATVSQVFEFLGLAFHEEVLRDRYPKNTSFRSISRESVLNRQDKMMIRLMSPVFGAIPLPFYESATRIKQRLSGGKLGRRRFHRHTFSMFEEEIWRDRGM